MAVRVFRTYGFVMDGLIAEILRMNLIVQVKITLGQILEFFVNLGVKNLIIIDMSCSAFKGNSQYLTERNIRQLRRKILV